MSNVLIICPVGEDSCHRSWNTKDLQADVALICYSKQSLYRNESNFWLHRSGMKWNLIAGALPDLDKVIPNYEFIWLPDDDLVTSAENLNRFFEIVQEESLALAQPALTQDSFYSWSHLLQDLNYTIRGTNFIEVMMPCFHRSLFDLVRSEFGQDPTGCGWGQEWYWSSIASRNRMKLGIVDQTPVKHTKRVSIHPPDSPTVLAMKAYMKRNRIRKFRPAAYGELNAGIEVTRNPLVSIWRWLRSWPQMPIKCC